MNNDLDFLKNKIVLITGVTGAIGYDLAINLLKRNISVIGICSGKRNKVKINSLKKYKNFKISYIDQSKLGLLEKHCQKIKKNYGCPEVIVNSAGIFKFKKLENNSISDILYSFNINIISPILITNFL